MRVVFLGNAAWSVPPLEALAESNHRPVLVVTGPPKPTGRGGKAAPTPVAEAGRRLGLSVAEVETVKAGPGFDQVARAEPDVLAVVAYGEILPPPLLELPTLMPVNVHFSLLPELRGAAPVQRAVLEGLAVTGVTTMRMGVGMDTGPILLQQEEAIAETDDAGSLGSRLAAIGGRLLVDTLDRLETRSLSERPQDEGAASYAPKLKREDEVIDWSRSGDQVVRLVRALAPVPGARTTIGGKVLKVFDAEPRILRFPPERWPPPGTLVRIGTQDGPPTYGVVADEGPVVVLREVALEGRRRMTGEEFLRGHRPKHGEILGG